MKNNSIGGGVGPRLHSRGIGNNRAALGRETVMEQMPAKRIDNLTSLRFFAAFSVFLHHLRPLGIDASAYLWNLNLGWTVSFFFVLSGFVLSHSVSGGKIKSAGDIAKFIAARFFRLWPLHITCALLAFIAFGLNVSATQIYLFLTLQHAFVPSYHNAFAVNAVTWSISVEMFFYIMFPFVILLTARKIVWLFCGWVVVILALMTAITQFPNVFPFSPPPASGVITDGGVTSRSFFHLFPPIRFAEFLCGMIIYQIWIRTRIPDKNVALCQFLCIITLGLYMTVHHDLTRVVWKIGEIYGASFAQYGMFPLFALVVYVFSHQVGPISKVISCRPMIYLGEISFAFYMVHQIVIRIVAEHFLIAPAWQLAALTFTICTLASILLFECIETPALALAKRKLYGRTSVGRLRFSRKPRLSAAIQ